MTDGIGRAEACANIALAKYWGKSEKGDNLTAVPSLSLTLDALRTRTEVVFDKTLAEDSVFMNGARISDGPLKRVVEMLDRIRAISGETRKARIHSLNNFPTAAGLASSASGFAALAVATSQAAHAGLSVAQLSDQARKSSASAARSLFEGFSILGAETASAEALAPSSHWDVAMVVAVISSSKKSVGSTLGMVHTKDTSPYYPAWVAGAKPVYERVAAGVMAKDFLKVAEAMEHSTRLMHATMITSEPPVLYLRGATVELMHEIARRRSEGEDLAYTMDAGPNVKILTRGQNAENVAATFSQLEGVERCLICRPGPAATTLGLERNLEDAERDDGVSFKQKGEAKTAEGSKFF